MSLTLMSKTETLDSSLIEPIFEGVEPVMDGPQIRRTVIGELEGNKLARIRRISMTVLKNEVKHHDYRVDLAAPYGRFGQNITVVYSSLWVVTALAAQEKGAVAEVKDSEQFAVFNRMVLDSMDSPEDIFTLYDEAKKMTPAITPDINPNIYTPEGMQELIETANFKSKQVNGEA